MENNKLDKRTKWSYCIGATGRDMAYALVSMFLLTYIQYTMKLTVAQYAVISAIMVVCLLWDAINDPMMGIIIENSHLKAGKFKPWIFIGVILNSLIIICLFTVRPEGWGFVAGFSADFSHRHPQHGQKGFPPHPRSGLKSDPGSQPAPHSPTRLPKV